MICEVTFDIWNYTHDTAKRAQLIELLNENDIEHTLDMELKGTEFYESQKAFFHERTHKLNITEIAKRKIWFQIKNYSDDAGPVADLANSVRGISQKLQELMDGKILAPQNLTVNLPSDGSEFLRQIKKVKLLEDACTDSLQKRLDEGYRLLAVCPQYNQRRPDYILGYVEELESEAAEHEEKTSFSSSQVREFIKELVVEFKAENQLIRSKVQGNFAPGGMVPGVKPAEDNVPVVLPFEELELGHTCSPSCVHQVVKPAFDLNDEIPF